MEKQGHFLAFGKSLRLCGQILEACTMWVWRSHSRSSPTFSYFFNQLHVGNGTCFQCLSFNLKISLPFSINAHWGQFLGCLNPLSWFNGVSNLLREHYIWHLPPHWTPCSTPYSFSWDLSCPCPYKAVRECKLGQNLLCWRKHQVYVSIRTGEREGWEGEVGREREVGRNGRTYILRLTPS